MILLIFYFFSSFQYFKFFILSQKTIKIFLKFNLNLKFRIMEKANEDVAKLIEAIKKIGKQQPDGSISTTFLEVFNETESYLESLNGTLRSAKKQKKIKFEGEMLLKGKNDKTLIVLLP